MGGIEIGNKKKEIVGYSNKVELNVSKKKCGFYGDLIALIPCNKTIMNNCKVTKRIATP